MMKKLRILVLLIILAFSFSVKAEIFLEIDCKSNEISDNKSVSCEVTLLYGSEGINDIEFNYDTNLDISFTSDYIINIQDNKLSIHFDEELYDEILNATTLTSFKVSSNDKVGELEKLIFSNITINNSIKIDDITKEFNIVKEIIPQDNICTLNSISVEKELIKNFDKDILEYHNIKVTNEYIFLDAVRTSDKSMATGLGTKKVPKGETVEHDITVTAEDGTKKIYRLFITNVTPKELSNDNSLKLLEIYHGKNKIKLDFDNKKNIYNIEIKDEIIDKLTIRAKLNNNKASFVKNYGPRDIKINYGLNKEEIIIKAENGDERVITINIYYIEKPVEILTNEEIIIPDEEVIENREIFKEEKINHINNNHQVIDIICYIVFVVGILCLIASTIYLFKNKK